MIQGTCIAPEPVNPFLVQISSVKYLMLSTGLIQQFSQLYKLCLTDGLSDWFSKNIVSLMKLPQLYAISQYTHQHGQYSIYNLYSMFI